MGVLPGLSSPQSGRHGLTGGGEEFGMLQPKSRFPLVAQAFSELTKMFEQVSTILQVLLLEELTARERRWDEGPQHTDMAVEKVTPLPHRVQVILQSRDMLLDSNRTFGQFSENRGLELGLPKRLLAPRRGEFRFGQRILSVRRLERRVAISRLLQRAPRLGDLRRNSRQVI